jgi:hypothetical protein
VVVKMCVARREAGASSKAAPLREQIRCRKCQESNMMSRTECRKYLKMRRLCALFILQDGRRRAMRYLIRVLLYLLQQLLSTPLNLIRC